MTSGRFEKLTTVRIFARLNNVTGQQARGEN
jgi:hypothetical protein